MKRTFFVTAIMVANYSFAQETLQTVTDRNNITNNTIYSSGSGRPAGNPAGRVIAMQMNSGIADLFGYDYGASTSIPLILQSPGGNVGIGTSAPAYRLDVSGSAHFWDIYAGGQISSLGYSAALGFQDRADAGKVWQWFADGSTAHLYNTSFGDAMSITENGSVTTAGNLLVRGISTTYNPHPLDALSYQAGNFSALVYSPDYDNGARPGYGFHAAGRYGGFLYQNGYNDYRIKEAEGSDYNLWTSGNFNPSNYLPLTGGQVSGNIGIGTENNSVHKLAVNGSAIFKKVVVKNASPWPDYVFDSSYRLAPLNHVETFIQKNKHLPDVPSAAEVKKDGLDLGDNQAVLLRKIEELTLYIIGQDKQIEIQKKENKMQKQQNAALETRLSAIEKILAEQKGIK